MHPPSIVVFSGARIIIVLPETTDGGAAIYIAQLSPVDKRRAGARSLSVLHDFDISNEGDLWSESTRTTCHARCPASVTEYRPASTWSAVRPIGASADGTKA